MAHSGSDPSSVNTSTSTLSQSLNGLNNMSFEVSDEPMKTVSGRMNSLNESRTKSDKNNGGVIDGGVISGAINNGMQMSNNNLKKSESELSNSLDESIAQKRSTLQRKGSIESIVSRGGWGNKWEFLLSCVGLSVGIGNVSLTNYSQN